MKALVGGIIGSVIGASVVAVPPLVSETVARVETRYVYDCAVRFGPDIEWGNSHFTFDGFGTKSLHKYGVCLDGEAPPMAFNNVTIEAPRFSNNAAWNAEWERQGGTTRGYTTSTPGNRKP